MPSIDGYTTARAIRAFEVCGNRQRCAIVAITGDDDIECVDKCLAAGMDGHLSKPTSIADLRTILERYVT
jgi:CheY-like chemotaxis protein